MKPVRFRSVLKSILMNKISWYIYLGIFLLVDGLFPIFSYFALQSMPTLWLFSVTTFLSLIFTFIVFLHQKLYTQYFKKDILLSVILSATFVWIGGLLYFFWIKYSSPSTASILLLLQSFFAFIVFNIFGKEDYHLKQVFGAILMFLGAFVILYQWEKIFSLWAIIMIVSWISFTIWNFYTKIASKKWASPIFLLLNRNLLMVVLTSVLAFSFVGTIEISLIQDNFLWIILIGFLALFIWKVAWISALARLDSFVAISSFPIIPVLVMIFSFIILKEIPSSREILWFIPIGIGTLLLTSKK